MKPSRTQLSQGGSSVHELEKAKRKLEQEKEELIRSLEGAKGQVHCIQLELTQLKQATEHKLAAKDMEMEDLRSVWGEGVRVQQCGVRKM